MSPRRFISTHPQWVDRFGDPFRPLEADCKVVQFSQPLTDDQLRQTAALMTERPDVQLYVHGLASRDLDFLGFFPAVKRLDVSLWELENIDGFASVGGLELLVFGKTKQTFPLGFLGRMTRLQELFLGGHKKEIEVVGGMTGLTGLGLSGVTLPDLSLLTPLTRLRDLRLLFGATTDLALLRALPALEALYLLRITKLEDLSVLADLSGLTRLQLDWMRNVTALPGLERLTRLESVTLETMKGLTDLSPLAAAPALRRLEVITMPQLTADSFRCFIGHPTLAELHAYTGSNPVNQAIKAMFPGIAR